MVCSQANSWDDGWCCIIQLPYYDQRPALSLFSYKPSIVTLRALACVWCHCRQQLPAQISSNGLSYHCLYILSMAQTGFKLSRKTMQGVSLEHQVGVKSKRPTLDQLVVYHVNMPANVNASMLFWPQFSILRHINSKSYMYIWFTSAQVSRTSNR